MTHNPLQPPDGPEKIFRDAMLQQAMQKSTQAFCLSIRQCMEEEAVNLEAAIVMGRELIERDIEVSGANPEADDMIKKAFNQAAIQMRHAINEAHALVRLDQNGSKEPKPYSVESHFEARAAEADRQLLIKAIFGDSGRK